MDAKVQLFLTNMDTKTKWNYYNINGLIRSEQAEVLVGKRHRVLLPQTRYSLFNFLA